MAGSTEQGEMSERQNWKFFVSDYCVSSALGHNPGSCWRHAKEVSKQPLTRYELNQCVQ